MAVDFRKAAEDIADQYVALVQKTLSEGDVEAFGQLVRLAPDLADLSELLVLTADTREGRENPTPPPTRRGRRERGE